MGVEEHRPGRRGHPGTHPESRDLSRFLCGETAPATTRRIVRHLLAGCPRCTEVLRPIWELEPLRTGEGRLRADR